MYYIPVYMLLVAFAIFSVGQSAVDPEVIRKLEAARITTRSSGNCDDKTKKSCTSLDGIRPQTIDGVIAFKRECGCQIVITGGTEVGHNSGTYSHGNGYKVDISKSSGDPALSKYIKENYQSIGGKKYKDKNGNIYYDEDRLHWDVTYF